MKHLLKLMDWSAQEITEVLDLADQLKFEKKNGIEHHHLKGKSLGMIFSKSSTRTRVSFEVGMYDLGGQALFLSSRDLQIGRGEPVQDTARVLSRYLDGIMIRTFAQKEVEDLATYGSIPIINGLTDYCHPCQVLADLMTIREQFGSFEGLKIAIVGDVKYSRVAHTNIEVMERLGMDVYISGPEEYNDNSARYINIDKAIEECDVIMLLRVQFERHSEAMSITKEEYNIRYGLNMNRVNKMKEKAIIMHPAPVNRGVEIADDVVECAKSRIIKQMTNGVYIRMAAISQVLDGKL